MSSFPQFYFLIASPGHRLLLPHPGVLIPNFFPPSHSALTLPSTASAPEQKQECTTGQETGIWNSGVLQPHVPPSY